MEIKSPRVMFHSTLESSVKQRRRKKSVRKMRENKGIRKKSHTSVGQRESPETEVRGSVGNATKAELDGVDDLVNHDLTEIKLLSVVVTATMLALVLTRLVLSDGTIGVTTVLVFLVKWLHLKKGSELSWI